MFLHASVGLFVARSARYFRHVARAFVVLVPMLTTPAWGFVPNPPPYLTPVNPVTGEVISVVVRGDACHLINDGVVWPPPVTQQGNVITVLFTGISEGDSEFCYYSSDARAYPVGTYPAGSYTLHVEWRYATFNGWTTETLAVIPFAVTAMPSAQPIFAPALSIMGLCALSLLLVAGAALALRRRFFAAVAFVPVLFSTPAFAFLDPPYITPANPAAGEPVSVNIYGGECDLVHDGITWPPPVTRHGNDVTILFTGIHSDNPEWCLYGTGTATYPVGTFPPGVYTLDVERRYGNAGGAWTQEAFGVIQFTVSGTALPVSAPALRATGLGCLSLLLGGVAFLRVRKARLAKIALLSAFFSTPASAFLDPPYITPSNPTPEELVSVSIHGGECDLVDYGINWPPPVTISGATVTITFTGIRETNFEFCYYSIGTSTYPVGTFSPGAYTLDVERRYGNAFGSWTQETLGRIPFTVAETPIASPASAPTLNTTCLLILLASLVGFSLRAVRRRIRQSC